MQSFTSRERVPLVGPLHTEGEGASVERFPPHKRSIACNCQCVISILVDCML